MAKYATDNDGKVIEISSITKDWAAEDETGKPYAGSAVQNFIKEALKNYSCFHNNSIIYFASKTDMQTWQDGDKSLESPLILNICAFGDSFDGKVYNVSGSATSPDVENLTKASTSSKVTITASTKMSTVSNPAESDFEEGYTLEVWRKSSSQSTFECVKNDIQMAGSSITINLVNYLPANPSGIYDFRFRIKGAESMASSAYFKNATRSTIYMSDATIGSVAYKWTSAYVQNEAFEAFSCVFGGDVKKKLVMTVAKCMNADGTVASDRSTKTIATLSDQMKGTSVINKPTMPSLGSGIYYAVVRAYDQQSNRPLNAWGWYFMYVTSADKNSVAMICPQWINNTFTNGVSRYLFYFSVYNPTAQALVIKCKNTGATNYHSVRSFGQIASTTTGSNRYYYNEAAEADDNTTAWTFGTEVDFGTFQADKFIGSGSPFAAARSVSNNPIYMPTTGANFYLNPAEQNNNDANVGKIKNCGKDGGTIDCTVENINWVEGVDGWITEDIQNGSDIVSRPCLFIPATARMNIAYQPLAANTKFNGGKTIELLFKPSMVTDYDANIITISSGYNASTKVYDEDNWSGIRIKGDRIIVRTQSAFDDGNQEYYFKPDEPVHLIITYIPNYTKTGCNTIIVACNGAKVKEIEWSSADVPQVNENIRFGSDACDLYIYKMRVYDNKWFSSAEIEKNHVASLATKEEKDAVSAKNNAILDGGAVSYSNVYNGGNVRYNMFVVEMNDGAKLPDAANTGSATCQTNFYYKGNSAWNFALTNCFVEGQGSTSKNYYRWNLRWNLTKTAGAQAYLLSQPSTKFTSAFKWAGNSNRTASVLCAKKNTASSMHGHKMGFCAMYDDLHNSIIGQTAPTAVKQFPFFGFLKNGTSYEFIGLYTFGPDKGDADYFDYKDKFISIEGAGFNIAGAAFRYPFDAMTNSKGKMSILSAKQWEYTLADDDSHTLWERWKNAYTMVFEHGPMLLMRTGSLPTKNLYDNTTSPASSAGNDGFNPNKYFNFVMFDNDPDGTWSKGDVYYYDENEQKYLKAFNAFSKVGWTAWPTTNNTENIRLLRVALLNKFLEVAHTAWDMNAMYFEYAFKIINALTDNFAKNYYPFAIGTNSKIDHRQDDLDTAMDINNSGQGGKPYNCEVNDRMNVTSVVDGAKKTVTEVIFSGQNSNLAQILYAIEEFDASAFAEEQNKYGTNLSVTNIVTARSQMYAMFKTVFQTIAQQSSVKTGNSLQKILGYYEDKMWNQAQHLFPISAYNADTEWTHEANKKAGVGKAADALTRVTGPHYEGEVQWMSRRLLYLMSKYGYGAFAGGKDNRSEYAEWNVRAGNEADVEIAYITDMYPVIMHNEDAYLSDLHKRVSAGSSVKFKTIGGNSPVTYVIAMDYVNKFKTTNLSTAESLNFTSKGLQTLILGETNRKYCSFSQLNLNCPCLVTLDARYIQFGGSVDLTNCKRVSEVHLEGSNCTSFQSADGGMLNKLYLPESIQSIMLKNLHNLSTLSIPSYANVTKVVVPGCTGFNVLDLMANVIANSTATTIAVCLQNLDSSRVYSNANVQTLKTIKTGNKFAYVDNTGGNFIDSKFVVSGKITVASDVSDEDVTLIKSYYPTLEITQQQS